MVIFFTKRQITEEEMRFRFRYPALSRSVELLLIIHRVLTGRGSQGLSERN
jgi:hypothetical protein